MRILITGAKGMLAYALQEKLKDHELITFDKKSLDVTNRDQILATIMEVKPDFVINTAAYTAVDDAEDNQDLAFMVNAEAAQYLAEACSTNDAFLIHFSTDYVFDGTNESGYKEDDKKKPINIYGQSKSIGEDLIMENCSRYAIIRTSWLFGPGGKNFAFSILEAAQSKPELKVVNDQKGCPTYTMDLAAAIGEFVNHPRQGVFHLTNSTVVSWYDFAKMLIKEAGLNTKVTPVSSNEFPRKAKRPTCSVLLNQKLQSLPPLEQAVKDFIKICPLQ